MIMWYTIIVASAILGTPLVVAQDDTCSTRYGFDIDLPGTSCVNIYITKILPAMVDLVIMFSKLIISSLPIVTWN